MRDDRPPPKSKNNRTNLVRSEAFQSSLRLTKPKGQGSAQGSPEAEGLPNPCVI